MEKILSDVAGSLMLSSDSPLDFHSEIFYVLAITVKYLYIG